ncbi:hypothetical protein MSG28_004267 [Choristoneura fumiferana]|uniref:Uncharacterized protein n=1 Tax=Choristoneura fumiferana TaxID=7141 RepID=A0ACC0KIK7_CHOFU|nr:hypothetical protein MSG28_004267 [Choristoneura fumiferana]
MSDMIINDSVPVDKKWNELIRYNIFIMKLVEFVISVVLMILPFLLPGAGIMHCLSVSPSLVMSLIFIVLYLVDQVHALAEQLYLVTQIAFNVTALLLNIIPHVVEPMGLFHCIVSAPTLVLSFTFMVLYIVDQVQNAAEMYYAIFELIMTLCAMISLIIAGKLLGAIYGLFYLDLFIALAMDIHYMKKERGWTF